MDGAQCTAVERARPAIPRHTEPVPAADDPDGWFHHLASESIGDPTRLTNLGPWSSRFALHDEARYMIGTVSKTSARRFGRSPSTEVCASRPAVEVSSRILSVKVLSRTLPTAQPV